MTTKTTKPKNLLENEQNEITEEMRMNSIYLQMEEGKSVSAIITGAAMRRQEFKMGESMVVDIRLQTVDENRTKIAQIPKFSKIAYRDIVDLLIKHNITIKKAFPAGTKANLKEYPWIATEIPVVIRPNPYNGKVWIGRIEEIPMEDNTTNEDSNLLEDEMSEIISQKVK